MQQPPGGTAYWYDSDDDDARHLLEALRVFRRSDEAMRRRAGREMAMNLTDLRALRHVIAAERRGDSVTPRDLAEDLGISTASTTKVLDRLTGSGHLERLPHPRDRRSVVVVATPDAHAEVRARLAGAHARMLAAARAVPEHCRPAVRDFLLAMAASVDTPDDAVAEAVVGDDGAPAAGR
ncbi:MarR family winged helix-turn-helix transcriptional regulator [Isoptericola jiangsuensis]|uniref:MarR family winged helix-turn-helix transcriptional regulator n=1 Tax=Isoptericola jiangsuensis TaxID=548579 RepID=UPI001FEBAED2|nr:MarR family transcriptional regulator [Isoptericola jiangsuensis]